MRSLTAVMALSFRMLDSPLLGLVGIIVSSTLIRTARPTLFISAWEESITQSSGPQDVQQQASATAYPTIGVRFAAGIPVSCGFYQPYPRQYTREQAARVTRLLLDREAIGPLGPILPLVELKSTLAHGLCVVLLHPTGHASSSDLAHPTISKAKTSPGTYTSPS